MTLVKKMLPFYILAIIASGILSMMASRTVTVLASAMEPPELRREAAIVLDPGHGGEDGGAVSPNGTRESGLNLEISLRLRDVCRFLGLPVTMTRETEISLHSSDADTVSEKKVSDLKNRVALVKDTPDPILVSIHQNMFEQPKYHGAQVLYAPSQGSEALAQALQAALRTGLDPQNHREPKERKDLYLLNKVSCPAVLIECGFLSNPAEESLLRDAAYQTRLAAVIGAALYEARPVSQAEQVA